MIIDTHHHFWDPASAEYPWMTDDLAPLARRFGPEDLEPELERCGVAATIAVQTRPSLDETVALLALAERTTWLAGVIGWVDLTTPAVSDQLWILAEGMGGRHLVGVRHQVHDEEDPDWLARPDVRRGLRAVADAGLVYDLLVRAREVPAAVAVARDLPGLTLVVDHLAKPRISEGRDVAWEQALANLAREPNVSVKLSGMVTEADWSRWVPADLEPFVDRALEMFGPTRAMFGSDWPVCTVAADYPRVLAALRAVVDDLGLGPGEQDGLFAGNALRTYTLEDRWPH